MSVDVHVQERVNTMNINRNRGLKSKRGGRWDSPDSENLFGAILNLRNIGEAKMFFRDLLTENEIIEFAQRWKVAKMLAGGTPYREIGRQTWMAPKTIARIQKWLKNGKGGYKLILHRTIGKK